MLLLDGEAGIGKSTVRGVATAQARAGGYRVLACRPVQAETALPFVALGDLLEPALDAAVTAALPRVQRLALEAALVREEPQEAFGRLAVSRAVLALLRALAAEAPLLVAIDDIQWLDAPSAAVLQFAFRRLTEGTVRALVAARRGLARPELEPPAGGSVRVLSLGPLTVDQLGTVLASRLDAPAARPRLAELHRATRGSRAPPRTPTTGRCTSPARARIRTPASRPSWRRRRCGRTAAGRRRPRRSSRSTPTG